jgi:ribosomal protein S27AE
MRKKKRPPAPTWRCPKCGATVTVSERDNDSRCGGCGFVPYDWHMPHMPPLMDDIPMSEDAWRHFNAEAEEIRRIREKQAKVAARSPRGIISNLRNEKTNNKKIPAA